ncbi:hypothetical protein CDL15_Pgr014222 [Punica granatum]|uniref:NAD-dependent epimerase/dehydratase domain-containing protein n=1 Tax=Punica granatum TaxID=22663 RepID=A0A218WDJ5_PUNGR|nr:hypothetical protein CDL15_Pgr014222 [Punica granatum]
MHNVLKACTEEKVKRVVYISSIAVVMLNPNWPKFRVKDETCWSDKEYCRATKSIGFIARLCHVAVGLQLVASRSPSLLLRRLRGKKKFLLYPLMAMAMAMAMAMEVERKRVCVTGAGGFVASWVVKLLLSKGYVVHGTVRDPKDEKYAHLSKLDRASDNLKIFKADLLDYDSLRTAIAGYLSQVEVLEPAVKGTLNVLKACKEVKIRRVVYVSSTAAVVMNPNWPKDQVMDESCWSSKEYCKATETLAMARLPVFHCDKADSENSVDIHNWYCLSKTEAESAAFEYAKQNGLDVVAVCPGLIFGPVLQLTLNSSTLVLVKLVQGGEDSVPNRLRPLVDVRDVAEAVIMAYEKPEAEGRYICVAHAIKTRDLAEKLRRLYPDFTYPKNYSETQHDNKLNSEKLQKLGWTYRPLEETLIDSIESYREAGLLK